MKCPNTFIFVALQCLIISGESIKMVFVKSQVITVMSNYATRSKLKIK